MTKDEARALLEALLDSKVFFNLSIREAIRGDPAILEDLLIIRQFPEICVSDESDALLDQAALEEYAARNAGGPGATYVGDGNWEALVGPGLGDANDRVSLSSLERENYLFDSPYYQNLLEKANLTNPTRMTYSGSPFEIQFACINRTVPPCELWANFFKYQVEERTNGKVLVPITSFPELGIAGPDTLELVARGALIWAEISSDCVYDQIPAAELPLLSELYPDSQTQFEVTQAIQPALDRMFEKNTDGGKVLSHMWVSGGDKFLLCQKSVQDLPGFEGRKVLNHGRDLSE